MNSAAQLASLLVVQNRRVNSAIALVQERNGVLRQRKLERDAAQQRWEGAVVAYRLERERLAEAIGSHRWLTLRIDAGTLTRGALRCEAHRAFVSESAKALADAEVLLVEATTAAAEARAIYDRTVARKDTLLTMQSRWRKDQSLRIVSLEPHGK